MKIRSHIDRSSIIRGKILSVDIDYSLTCRTDDNAIILTVALDELIDWTKIANFMLKSEINPKEYIQNLQGGGYI